MSIVLLEPYSLMTSNYILELSNLMFNRSAYYMSFYMFCYTLLANMIVR